MTIYDLKPKFQNLLRPVVVFLAAMGVSPNQVTILTCLLSVFLGALVYHLASPVWFFLYPVFFFLRMALNAIDGMLAKEHNMQSKLGAILNESTDVLSDGVLYYSFSALPFFNAPLLHFIILLSALSEIIGLAALLNGKPRCYAGPSGKSDRAFIFGVMAIMVGSGMQNEGLYSTILTIVMFLLVATLVNRTRKSI